MVQLPPRGPSDVEAQRISPKTLVDKIAIVSGSTRGIGKGIALELSSRGATVIINYPTPDLEEEANAVVESLPSPAHAVCADLSTIEGPAQLAKAVVQKFGHVDILVNSAGVALSNKFMDATLEDWDRQVNLNCRGMFLLTQAVLPSLTKPGGRIVNIVSSSSRDPSPTMVIYSGTKGFVDSVTQSWAKELPPKYGCTVNAVSPGPTRTEGFEKLVGESDLLTHMQSTIDAIPAGARLGETSEIAYSVAFLCEERARWVNGTHLHTNGGMFVD